MHKAKEDYKRGIIADKFNEIEEHAGNDHVWCGDSAINDYYKKLDSMKGDEEVLTKQCPRCRKIIPYGMPYCENCRPMMEEQADQSRATRARHYSLKRDKRSKAFYNSNEWIRLSQTRLQHDEYRCQICGGIATEVHHKTPLTESWDDRFEWNNIISVCVSCHNRLDKRFR